MSKEILEQFMYKVADSEELQAKIGEEIDAEALIALGAECGCEFTAEELQKAARWGTGWRGEQARQIWLRRMTCRNGRGDSDLFFRKHSIYAIIVGPVARKRVKVTTGPRYTAYIIGGVSAFLLLDLLYNILKCLLGFCE